MTNVTLQAMPALHYEQWQQDVEANKPFNPPGVPVEHWLMPKHRADTSKRLHVPLG